MRKHLLINPIIDNPPANYWIFDDQIDHFPIDYWIFKPNNLPGWLEFLLFRLSIFKTLCQEANNWACKGVEILHFLILPFWMCSSNPHTNLPQENAFDSLNHHFKQTKNYNRNNNCCCCCCCFCTFNNNKRYVCMRKLVARSWWWW